MKSLHQSKGCIVTTFYFVIDFVKISTKYKKIYTHVIITYIIE